MIPDNNSDWDGLWRDREDVREETRHLDYWVKPEPELYDRNEDCDESYEQHIEN